MRNARSVCKVEGLQSSGATRLGIIARTGVVKEYGIRLENPDWEPLVVRDFAGGRAARATLKSEGASSGCVWFDPRVPVDYTRAGNAAGGRAAAILHFERGW